ncbi:MAG: TIGR01777 family oxidoreductase [Bacteroidales bacterium]|nr:TIGR01777 family oxidoreductase [Bacteroidales bacterium]
MFKAYNILISGSSGLIGKSLTQFLKNEGHSVAILSRSENKIYGTLQFKWDPNRDLIDLKAVEWADVIINLAGENIGGKRWSKKQKVLIKDSRINAVNTLYNACSKVSNPPCRLINASAIGFYGTEDNKVYNEESDSGIDFLSNVVKCWEEASVKFDKIGIKTLILRFGVVFAKEGGAFPKLLAPVKLGFGAPIGSGEQPVSWVSLSDILGSIAFLLKQPMEKNRCIYNIVAPEVLNNKQLTSILNKYFRRLNFWPSLPAFVFKVLLGEQADIVLKGNRVSSENLLKKGYQFKHKKIEQFLKENYPNRS